MSAKIEDGHGLTLEINSILEQFQRAIKAFKLLCGNNDILNNVTPQVSWNPNKTFTHSFSNVSRLKNNSDKKSDPRLAWI